MSKPFNDRLPVLVEESVWPEFQPSVASLGETWTAPSGRVYALELSGERLVVCLVVDSFALPSGAEIDEDLFELACTVQDRVGGPWSGDALRRMVEFFHTKAKEAAQFKG
jgi:hypothetical protein